MTETQQRITAETVRDHIAKAAANAEDIEIEDRQFLVRCGWKYTCDTPGALWMYQKTIDDGRTLLVGPDTALTIEEAIRPAGSTCHGCGCEVHPSCEWCAECLCEEDGL